VSNHEIPALWESALDGEEGEEGEEFSDSLADQIVAQALSWYGRDPERLREATRVLAKTPYLASEPELCEVDDCQAVADPCWCGAAHCQDHPHISDMNGGKR
jgi:hypothetical protein